MPTLSVVEQSTIQHLAELIAGLPPEGKELLCRILDQYKQH